jgi:serine phosphatase RsbU (regulator of sigma subunit)
MTVWNYDGPQIIRRAWGRVRWKMAAIVTFTGSSTVLIACLAAAALNVVVRREASNVVEKQIQTLVQASRSVAPAILDQAGDCMGPPATFDGLKPLLAYTDEAFPKAHASLIMESGAGAHSWLAQPDPTLLKRPDWLRESAFTGLVADRGQLEIRNVMVRQKGAYKVTAIFSLPLSAELGKRLSAAAGMEVTLVSPRQFRVHSPTQRLFRTMEGNFMPGVTKPAAVVLSVRNWQTGALEDWVAYNARGSYSATFEDVARLGSQLASWVWLLAALSLLVLILDASGVWMSIHFGNEIAAAIDGLSNAARQIAGGNFAWRTPVRSSGQLGDLVGNFNEMAIALGRLHAEEAAKLRMEAELQTAHTVQEYLFPRVAPALPGITVCGRTVAARTIGGDLYDFFELDPQQIGILCADVSGKGIPAALMMASLQAVARAHVGDGIDSPSAPPAQFVEALNRQLAGRFGDNRYATLFWATYDASAARLTYVNAGHPPAILIRPDGEIERLGAASFPVGMFADVRYTASTVPMGRGSRLVIFTDGLTDAQNSAGEEFGDEGLIACCKALPAGIGAEEVADRLMEAIAEWSAGTEQYDDTTVVVIDAA